MQRWVVIGFYGSEWLDVGSCDDVTKAEAMQDHLKLEGLAEDYLMVRREHWRTYLTLTERKNRG